MQKHVHEALYRLHVLKEDHVLLEDLDDAIDEEDWGNDSDQEDLDAINVCLIMDDPILEDLNVDVMLPTYSKLLMNRLLSVARQCDMHAQRRGYSPKGVKLGTYNRLTQLMNKLSQSQASQKAQPLVKHPLPWVTP